MTNTSLSDFQITERLREAPEWMVCLAQSPGRSEPVRLTVFDQLVSQRPDFRRAFKTDRNMLATLRHPSILRFLGDGESDGCLFYWTEFSDSQSLRAALAGDRPLQFDDLIEIGWQVCSSLQQAHNLGLSHGGICADNVLLSTDLQVTLVDFGVHRWLQAAEPASDSPHTTPPPSSLPGTGAGWRREVEQDLADLATVLLQPVAQLVERAQAAGTGSPPGSGSLRRLLERVRKPAEHSQPISARDMQGRLGELLIGEESDEMQLFDQREQPMKSRRSIVDELFDHPQDRSRQNLPAEPIPAVSRFQVQILPIIILLLLVIIVLLAAGLFA